MHSSIKMSMAEMRGELGWCSLPLARHQRPQRHLAAERKSSGAQLVSWGKEGHPPIAQTWERDPEILSFPTCQQNLQALTARGKP